MRYSNKYLLSGLLVLIAAVVIFWQFPQIPQKLTFDELEFSRLALNLQKHPTVFSPEATGHATPYFFLILASFKIFGVNSFALRLPAALFAMGCTWLTYALFIKFFQKKEVAFLGGVTFITLHWFFNFGRFAFEGSYLLFWELLALYSIRLFLDERKGWYFNLGLFATVLTFYSYLPGRIFFVLPTVMLFMDAVKRKNYRSFAEFTSSFVFWILPLLLTTFKGEERINSLSFLSADLPFVTKIGMFVENVWKNIYMLFGAGDLNGRHNYPGKSALNPLLVSLLLLGLLNIRKNKNSTLMFLFWILAMIPSLFTYPSENPHFLRTLSTTAPIVFFITNGIQLLWKQKLNFVKGGLVLLLTLSMFYELRTYYHYQVPVFRKAFEIKKVELEKLSQSYEFKTIWNK